LSAKKISPSELQERVLTLIDQHVSLIEKEVTEYTDYLEQVEKDTWDSEQKKPEVPRFLSGNLTAYLKSLSDYQEAKDDGIGRQLKALQKMSKEQLEKMKDKLDGGNK